MLEKLGIVTNCWSVLLGNGGSFEGLVRRFCSAGLKHIEIRDGEYLRSSSFGDFLGNIEHVMWHYSFDEWQDICGRIHHGALENGCVKDNDAEALRTVQRFILATGEAVYSYAMTFPWMEKSIDVSADEKRISTAFRLAYLLNPVRPRTRLVSLTPFQDMDTSIGVRNLRRYLQLVPAGSAVLTVENARFPTLLTLQLAKAAGLSLAYDEANNFYPDGKELCGPKEFWKNVRLEDLSSVHIKQRNGTGVLPRLGDGFVDIPLLLSRLRKLGYEGDVLFELAPTKTPLEDALHAREYVLRMLRE